LVVLGGHAPLAAIGAVAGTAVDTALGASVLADVNLVTVIGDDVSLEHALLGDVALEALESQRRRELFVAATRWLEQHAPSDSRLAYAYGGSGRWVEAFEHAKRAARDALVAGTGRLAVDHFEEALTAGKKACIDKDVL
jgi:hypothetical protein